MARPKVDQQRKVAKSRLREIKEATTVRTIDHLAVYDDIFSKVMPELRQDIASGMSALQLAKKYAQLAQARVITTALTDKDATRALAASKDILDRALGKAKETKEVQHSMAQASDAELDALILSKLKDVSTTDPNNSDDKK